MGACRVRVHSWLLRRDLFFTYPTVLKWPDWGKEIVSLVGEGPTRVGFVTSPVPACRSCGAGNAWRWSPNARLDVSPPTLITG